MSGVRMEAPHPRDAVCEAAGQELLLWAADWRNRHGLSSAEYLYLLGVLQHRHVQAVCVSERERVEGPLGGPPRPAPTG